MKWSGQDWYAVLGWPLPVFVACVGMMKHEADQIRRAQRGED